MAHHDYPRGAGFGRDTNRRSPALIDYTWIARNGSRAQRREAVRLLRQHAAKGNQDAAVALAELNSDGRA